MGIQAEIMHRAELENYKEKITKSVYEIFKDLGLIIGTPTGEINTSSYPCNGPNIRAGIFEHYENDWGVRITPDAFTFIRNGLPEKMQNFLDYYEAYLKERNLKESKKLEDLEIITKLKKKDNIAEEQVNEKFKKICLDVNNIGVEVSRILYDLTGKALGTVGSAGNPGDRDINNINDTLANLQMVSIGIKMILEHLYVEHEKRAQ